jgi:hypothetical protein
MRPTSTACIFRYRGFGFLFVLCPVLVSAAASAQDIAAAEALFKSGLADMQAGRYETGCKELAESHRMDPRLGTLFTLATCEARWGHTATAVARFSNYLALYDRLSEERKEQQGERPRVAKEQMDKLLPDVPHLTIVLSAGAPAGTVVKRDGEVVSDVAIGLAVPVDPGDHTLSIQAPGQAPREQQITIAKGEDRRVTLSPAAGAAPASGAGAAPAPAAKEPSPSRSYAGPILAFGGAAAGLGVGVGFGLLVLDRRSRLDTACPDKLCPAPERGSLDDAKTFSHISTAGFVVAGVGATLGTVLLLLPGTGEARETTVGVRVGLSSLGVEGAF